MCVFYYISYSTATAQTVSVESSPQLSCPNETLFFNCSLDFPSIFIRWNHEAFGTITFFGSDTSLGSNDSAIDDIVFAKVTMREGTVGLLYRLTSTLTIYPPLTDLNNNNLNGTNIMCEGDTGTGGRSGIAVIILEGEELKV